MAISSKAFAKFPLSALNKELDLNSDTIKCALFTSAHAPSQTDDQYYDGAHGMTEVTQANGYLTGGTTVTSPTINTSSLTTTFDCDDPSWTVTGSGFTYRYAVFYDASPSSNKPMIAYVDFGVDQSVAVGTHSISLNASGVARIIVS